MAVARPLAQDANAVLFFGQIDQLKVGSETAGDQFCLPGTQMLDDQGQPGIDGRVLLQTPSLGQDANALLQFEYLDARLPPDDMAEYITQKMDVFAQSLLFFPGQCHGLVLTRRRKRRKVMKRVQ